ncbi:MAG: hypothetical protein ACTSUE_19140 [Promethearchaeota archaeon]
MKKSNISLAGIFIIACFSLSSTLVSGHHTTVATPVTGETYSYTVLKTNGVVEWYDSSFNSLGNISIMKLGIITYTLTGMYPNDEMFPGNITGDVWYGDVSIKGRLGSGVEDWSTLNASTTEAGWALTLSVSVWPQLSWAAGFIAPGNLSEISTIFDPAAGNSMNYTLGNGMLKVWIKDPFQESYFEWDEATGVLLYARTVAGQFTLEMCISAYEGGIPGYEPAFITLLVGTSAIFLCISVAKKKIIR